MKLAQMFEQIVGTSPPLRSVLSRVSKVAPTDSSVLITGESGTGKELVARAIHRRSRRSARAFVSVNCAAIPRDLLESELFGYKKGAFTGADRDKRGLIEFTEGGTLLLDEIAEMIHFLFAQIRNLLIRIDLRAMKKRERTGAPDSIDIRQPDRCAFPRR